MSGDRPDDPSSGGTPPPVSPPPPGLPPYSAPNTPPAGPPPPSTHPSGRPLGPPIAPGPDVVPGYPEPTTPGAPFDITSRPADQPPRRPWPLLAGAVVGVVVLVCGGLWLAFGALTSDTGAASPEAAATQLFDALENEDFLAMTELMDPGERRSLVEPMFDDIVPQLSRIGVLSDDIDLGAISGVDLSFRDVQFEIRETAHADLVHAIIVDGEATAMIDPADLPFGDVLLDDMSGDPVSTDASSVSDDADAAPIAIVERDGRWYVSLWHTIAESARLATGERLPASGDRLQPNGSKSPEAAVDTMIAELVDIDIEGVVATVDPEELDVVYRYWPMVEESVNRSAAEASRLLDEAGVSIDVSDLAFDVETDGADATVAMTAGTLRVDVPDGSITVAFDPDELQIDGSYAGGNGTAEGSLRLDQRRFELNVDVAFDGTTGSVGAVAELDTYTATISGSLDGEQFSGTVVLDPDNVCSEYELTGPELGEGGCLEDLDGQGGDGQGIDQFTSAVIAVLDSFAESDGFGALPPIATHRVDGQWYISPLQTGMGWLSTGLQSVGDDTVTDVFEQFGSLDEFASLPDLLDEGLGSSGGFDPDVGFDDDAGFDLDVDLDVNPNEDRVDLFDDIVAKDGATVTADIEVVGATSVVGIVGPPGAMVSVAAIGYGAVDTVIEVSGDGLLETNDDYSIATGFDAGLVFQMPSSGFVSLAVTDFSSGTGDVRLAVATDSAGSPPDPSRLIETYR